MDTPGRAARPLLLLLFAAIPLGVSVKLNMSDTEGEQVLVFFCTAMKRILQLPIREGSGEQVLRGAASTTAH